MQALIDLFGLKDLIPHGYCLSWSPVLLWLNVITDLLMTLSFYSIPLMLVHFIRQRKDVPYSWLVAMFAGFIVACGTMHLLAVITIWIPLYWLDGLLKGFTAVLSVATAVLMLRVIPRALSLPSYAQLQAEIQQRKTAEEALRVANVALQKNSARTQLLLDSALDGIVSMDHNGNVIGWNNQAEHIFGYSAEQAVGRELAELIVPPAYREQHRQGLSRFMTTGASNIIGERLEITGLNAGAFEFPIELTVSALGQKDDYSFSAYVRDITERKKAEAAQQEALDRLQKIASQLPGVVFQFRLRADGSSCLPYASKVLHDIYRIDPEEVRDDAAKVFGVVHPDDLDGHLASIHASARDLSPWRNEYRLRFADGTERWLFGNALPQREQDGSVLWHGFVTDITERKQMDEKLRDSDAFNASILDSLTSHIAVLDAQGVIVAVNNAWRQFAKENGLSESGQDMLGVNYLDACKGAFNQAYGDEANTAQAGIMAVLAGELKTFYLEYPCHSPNQQRWFQMYVSPLQGSRPGVVVSHKNITERKKAEEVARAASQYARSLIEASLDPLVTISAEGKITDVNTATEQVTGVGRDNLIGSDFADYFTDPEKARAGYRQVFSQDFVFDYPLAIRHVSGKVTDVLYNASVYHDRNGNTLGVFAAARDITERKVMEDELKASEAKFRSIIEVSPIPMAMNDERLNVTFLNSAFVQAFGYCIDDIPTLEDWWPRAYPDPDYRDWVKTTWKTTLEKAKQEQTDFPPMEVAVRCKNNSIKIVLATAVTIKHDFAGMNLAILYDITQLKQIEAELTRSNAELEQFAYAVSHDMRQPLRMVTSYLSLIEDALTGSLNEETQQFLDFAVNGAKRMDAMILSLLDYSRIGRKFEAKIQLSSKASLDEALAFLNPELSACGGEIKVTGDWPELFASRDELTRLLQNLIGNALKYHEENKPPQVHIHGKISAESLRVEVRDQGIGIEPSQMDRLFKVFSRLQARSRFDGTGVGLALCRKIVEHHGGTIGVESAGEGQGCVFWFELPIVKAANSE
ncbi:MAG: PAS domain S-box protein [Methylobacter sp.]|nr:PAS domain S-box protein [Methylobacter sp.]